MSEDSPPNSTPTRLRILALEDDPRDAELIRANLQAAGLAFDLHHVATEAEFGAALESGGFDLVLADYCLPGTDGGVALQICRERRPEWPFIFVSGSLGEELAIETLKRGAADYVLKDRLHRLPVAVERAVREARERAARRSAERALRESEQTFRVLVDTSPTGILIHAGAQCLYVNSIFETLTGYSRDELLSMSFWEIVHPDFRQSVRERGLARSRSGDGAGQYEFKVLTKGGQSLWVDLRAAPVQFQGQPAVLAALFDVTERKAAEKALAASEERYRRITRCVPDLIWAVDLTGRYLYASPAVERTHGWTVEEFLRFTYRDVVTPSQAAIDAAMMDEALVEANRPEFDHNSIRTFESEERRKDGSVFRAEVSTSFLWSDDGKPIGFIGITRDITERKQAEEEKRVLQAQLIQAQKMEAIGQLAGGVAHDFNNILTAVLMQLHLLREEPGLPAEVREGLSDLESEAKRAAALTRQLLMFSRRQVLQPQTFDLNSLLGNLLKMLRRLIGEQVMLEFNGAPGNLWLTADPGMFEQVVLNLVVNARDAMPQGGRVTLVTQNLELGQAACAHNREARPGRFACLTVADTGCGMDEATRQRLFEPFFTTKEPGKGTGLGLATVYGIVKQHQGWVEVESEPGRGSSFRVYLPASPEALVSEVTAAQAKAVPGGSETILVVEDAESVRRVMVSTLRRLGYRVVEAANSQEALALWPQERASAALLLTDMVMPGAMSGQELGQRLRRDKPSLKCLLVSGYSRDLGQEGFSPQLETAFLAKPLQPAALAEKVRACLDGK